MWLGNFPAGFTTVPILFTTHASTGAPVAPNSAFEAADVLLYKNGSATQRTSTSGWTMTSPFDSITGLHRLLIDLSDDTDAGFYAAGAVYTAVLSPDETVDSVAVVKVLGQFSIDMIGLTATERTAIADALLNRDMSTGTDSGSASVRTVRQALRFLRNKWTLTGTTLSVKKEDDSTESWAATVTTDAAAEPITASDPAS